MNQIQEHNEAIGIEDDIKEDKLRYAALVGDDSTKSIYNAHKSESLKDHGPFSYFWRRRIDNKTDKSKI